MPGTSFLKSLFIMDNSPRTKAISRPTWVTMGALFTVLLCLFWAVAGCRHYSNIQMNSSTPVGTQIKFARSGAMMTLSGLYTDKNDDVLVARLTPDAKTNQNLPYRGKDFTVFVQSAATDRFEELPILFGKMGTDGDYMLILPKPSDDVYSFVLVDSSSQAKRLDKQRNPTSVDQDKDKSVARALSDFNKELLDNQTQDVGSSQSAGASGYDMAGFRMTMNPRADGPQYVPTRVNTDLLDQRTKQFNFEGFYQEVFVDAAVKTLTEEYNQLEAQAEQFKEIAEAEQGRLDANPADEAAAKNLANAQRQAEDANRQKEEKAEELTRYQTLDYDPGMFQNFQDKAVVVKR